MVVETTGGALVEAGGGGEVEVAEAYGTEDDGIQLYPVLGHSCSLVGTLSGTLQAAHDSYWGAARVVPSRADANSTFGEYILLSSTVAGV